MKKIEHIGIAVKNLEEANELYRKLLNTPPYKLETVESEFVNTSFFRMGQSKIELLAPTNEKSAIHKFLEKKGEGFHHIAFAVDDIVAETERLKSEGFQALSNAPKKGADNKLVMFFHPKTTGGLLVELCQEIKE
jgi:methylmalonyl-CoA/ethylmalonyl-CoA epimerase